MFYSRRNIRAEFNNYSEGIYFVTICTRNKEHYFGEIANDTMHSTEMGFCAQQLMSTLSTHYPYAEIINFVVMPNHLHAMIGIHEKENSSRHIPPFRTALSVVIGEYKQSVTMYARRNGIEFGWQSRYHDHIIRNNCDAEKIAKYIDNNVSRWADDCFYL